MIKSLGMTWPVPAHTSTVPS